MMILLVKE
jgi:cerevisin